MIYFFNLTFSKVIRSLAVYIMATMKKVSATNCYNENKIKYHKWPNDIADTNIVY